MSIRAREVDRRGQRVGDVSPAVAVRADCDRCIRVASLQQCQELAVLLGSVLGPLAVLERIQAKAGNRVIDRVDEFAQAGVAVSYEVLP